MYTNKINDAIQQSTKYAQRTSTNLLTYSTNTVTSARNHGNTQQDYVAR